MITIEKVVGELSKKETMKVSENIGVSIKALIEAEGVCMVLDPKYVVLAHVKGEGENAKKFDCYVFCDCDGKLYSCGKINAAETAVAYMRELADAGEEYALQFSFQTSRKTGNRFIKCELI